MPAPKKYPDELRERGVRLALESDRPIAQVAKDLGIGPESLRLQRWMGHYSAAHTLDVYGHLIDAELALALDLGAELSWSDPRG